MWDNLSYQKKVYIIFGAFFLFILLAYMVVFSKTVSLFKETEVKKQKLVWLKEKEKEIPVLQSQMVLLNKAYDSGDSIAIRDQLIAFISDYAENNNCLVTSIPERALYSNLQLNIQSNRFVVKGNFNQLLQLLFKLEKEFNYSAKVVSAKFYSTKDLQTKQMNLFLLLITQSFRQQSETQNLH